MSSLLSSGSAEKQRLGTRCISLSALPCEMHTRYVAHCWFLVTIHGGWPCTSGSALRAEIAYSFVGNARACIRCIALRSEIPWTGHTESVKSTLGAWDYQVTEMVMERSALHRPCSLLKFTHYLSLGEGIFPIGCHVPQVSHL